MAEIKAVVGDHRINPAWVEQCLAFPPAWTDLNAKYTIDDIRGNLRALHKYPATLGKKQLPHENPRHISVPKESVEAWRPRMRQLGNCQDPLVARTADEILTKHINGIRRFF